MTTEITHHQLMVMEAKNARLAGRKDDAARILEYAAIDRKTYALFRAFEMAGGQAGEITTELHAAAQQLVKDYQRLELNVRLLLQDSVIDAVLSGKPAEVLCQDCLRIRPYSDARHNADEQCECGGDFCGCKSCIEKIAGLRASKRGELCAHQE